MKRYLPTILLVAILGGLALVVPVAVGRWSARMAASASSKLDAAKQAAVDGDDDGAIERYRAYLDAAGPSPDPDALEAYALLLLRRAARPRPKGNEVAAAFDAAEVAVRQRPESVELRRRLGELKLATGKPIEAREHLLIVREAIERGASADEPAAIDLLLAKAWAESGDVDRAAPIFARLIGFNLGDQAFAESGTAQEAGSPPPADAEAFLLLANLLRDRLRAPAAADVVLERAHELHPDSVKVLLAYSRMKAAANDVPAARAAAARAAEVDPTDASAILADAQIKASGGSPAAATAAFLTARTQFPDHKGIFLAALPHFQRHGTESETLELLAEGLSKYADEPRYLSFVSAMKLPPESLAPFMEALDDARTQRAADHPALVLLEARLCSEQHQWYRAESLLGRSRALVPENSKLRIDILLAICHQQLGDNDLRLALLQRYAKPGATPDFILAGIAAAQLDLGQTDAALASVRMLERRVEGSAEADDEGDADGGVGGDVSRSQRKRALLFALSTIVAVERTQPAAKRDWSAAETLLEELEAMPWEERWQLALPRADLLAAGGDIAGALAILDPFLSENAELHQLQARRLTWRSKLDGIDGAREAFARMPEATRAQPIVLLALADAERAAAVGDDRVWLEQIAVLAENIPEATDALEVFQALARMAFEAGWLEESASLWRRGAKVMPDDFRPPLGLALLAARKARLDGARASAGETPSSAEAAAAAAEKAAVVAEAAAAAAEVAKLDGPDTPRSRVARAAALVAEARAGERGAVVTPSAPFRLPAKEADLLRSASQRLVEAANDRPTWQAIALLAGEIALVGNDFSTAIDQMKQGRAFGPDNAPLTRDLIETLTKAGRFAEANLLQATVAPAGLGGAVRTSIEAEMRGGDLEGAAERSLRVIDVEKADADTLLWLGRLCGRSGRREQAGELFLRATQAAPDNPETWLWLARFEVAGGNKDAAEGVIARGIEAVPEGVKKLLAARGAVTVGRLDDAERDFLAAVAASGADIAPAGHTVDFYLQQGKAKQAEAFLETLIGRLAGDLSRNDLESWAVRRLDGLRAAAKLPDASR
jgi:Tfp pilus assembly protein PilF